MRATDQRARTVRDTATCRLPPERLFDLLANPTERQTWDLCPAWMEQEPIAAAPGLALRGATYTLHGKARGIPFRGSTIVTRAERPSMYAYRSESSFERAYPSAWSEEEYRIEPDGEGSRVHYTVTMGTMPGTGSLVSRVVQALLGPFVTASAARRNFRDQIRYAERFAGVGR